MAHNHEIVGSNPTANTGCLNQTERKKPCCECKISKLSRAKFRVKIRSLAEEARIIRHEEKKAERGPDQAALWSHRTIDLRNESRSSQLAYAFSRGVPFAVVERGTRMADTKRIAAIVRSLTGCETLPHDIENWMKEKP